MKNRLEKALNYIQSMDDKQFEEFLIRNDSSVTVSYKNASIAYGDLLLSPIKSTQQSNFYTDNNSTDLSWAA